MTIDVDGEDLVEVDAAQGLLACCKSENCIEELRKDLFSIKRIEHSGVDGVIERVLPPKDE
ncbi:MAG: hypothetical protein ACTSU5_06275 [Promethearchaeota archaeon]